jgi:hypothetical protein
MKPRRRLWDEQVINACMFPHDASEVMKTRLSEREDNDILAWHPKARIFA